MEIGMEDYELIGNFIARGEFSRGDISFPATIIGSCSKYGYDSVKCTIVPDNNLFLKEFGYLYDLQIPIQLRIPNKNISIPVFLPSTDYHYRSQSYIEGIAEVFIQGNQNDFDATKGEFFFYALVPEVSFIKRIDNLDYDGTIGPPRNNFYGIRWHTPFGEATLIDNYEFYNDELNQNAVLVRTAKYMITIQNTEDFGTTSMSSILSKVTTTLNDPLILLSFINRKYLTWYEAGATFRSTKSDFRRTLSVRRQQKIISDSEINASNFSLSLPVKWEPLESDLFQRLLDNFQASPIKKNIEQAIQYLVKSYEKGYFQARLGIIYAALESLVDGLSDADQLTYLLSSSRFKHLVSKLKPVIEGEIPKQDINKGVINKLTELRRRSFAERLLILLNKYDLDDIELYDKNIASELNALLGRRNLYIHQGKIDETNVFDFYRLQKLLEIWILKLLNCPDSAINLSSSKIWLEKDIHALNSTW